MSQCCLKLCNTAHIIKKNEASLSDTKIQHNNRGNLLIRGTEDESGVRSRGAVADVGTVSRETDGNAPATEVLAAAPTTPGAVGRNVDDCNCI